jgi:hypothetical protein
MCEGRRRIPVIERDGVVRVVPSHDEGVTGSMSALRRLEPGTAHARVAVMVFILGRCHAVSAVLLSTTFFAILDASGFFPQFVARGYRVRSVWTSDGCSSSRIDETSARLGGALCTTTRSQRPSNGAEDLV